MGIVLFLNKGVFAQDLGAQLGWGILGIHPASTGGFIGKKKKPKKKPKKITRVSSVERGFREEKGPRRVKGNFDGKKKSDRGKGREKGREAMWDTEKAR